VHELEVHQVELELQNEELRAARLETEAGLERYTELFDFAPIGYLTLATDETIREINHVGAQLLGRPRSRLIGQPLSTFVAIRDIAGFRSMLGKTFDTDTKERCEIEISHRIGQPPRHVRVTSTMLSGDDRKTLLAVEDITESKLREKKLAATEAALRDADRRKDEFLAVLSHELRNPLAPIRSSLFVLAGSEPGGDKARESLTIIDRQIGHLTRLIDDLLDVTRIARGKIELQRELLDLADLVRRTMEDYRGSLEARGIHLEGRFQPDPFWIDADPARIVQAISNLFGNAEKFTPRGGRVTVSLERNGKQGALRIRDTGSGIAADLLTGLFEPFAQAPQSIARSHGGLGLGLAMVKGLVELHGGSVNIQSPGANRGTEVTMFLPLASAPAVGAPEPVAAPAPRSRRVLVIDDNVDTADSMRSGLELSGHAVQVAYDGQRGLELARTFRPEIVLCDIGLPGMDGYAFARALRADATLKDVFLVALSGYTRAEDLRRATDAGFDEHLAKPSHLERIERLITTAPEVPTLLH